VPWLNRKNLNYCICKQSTLTNVVMIAVMIAVTNTSPMEFIALDNESSISDLTFPTTASLLSDFGTSADNTTPEGNAVRNDWDGPSRDGSKGTYVYRIPWFVVSNRHVSQRLQIIYAPYLEQSRK
jgi:hypothetical protein